MWDNRGEKVKNGFNREKFAIREAVRYGMRGRKYSTIKEGSRTKKRFNMAIGESSVESSSYHKGNVSLDL